MQSPTPLPNGYFRSKSVARCSFGKERLADGPTLKKGCRLLITAICRSQMQIIILFVVTPRSSGPEHLVQGQSGENLFLKSENVRPTAGRNLWIMMKSAGMLQPATLMEVECPLVGPLFSVSFPLAGFSSACPDEGLGYYISDISN